jgi:hypothetical protein
VTPYAPGCFGRAHRDAWLAAEAAAKAANAADQAAAASAEAQKSADQARASAIAAGKSSAEAEAAAKAAWKATRDLLEQEMEQARQQAAEERKRQEEQEGKPKRVCVPNPTRETMIPVLPCVHSPGDSVIVMPLVEPMLTAVVW